MAKKIIFTGGGTAGHVMPNVVLIKEFKKKNWDMAYIGRFEGIEKDLIDELDIKYYGVSTGKLRRYYSIENYKMPFRVMQGIIDAYDILKAEKPDVIFSKGGFVAVPVSLAAKFLKIPVIVHESDTTVGLANKISIKFAKKICVSFIETLKELKHKNATYTGSPIREEIKNGSIEKGFEFTGVDKNKKTILVMGGSMGSKCINDLIRDSLSELKDEFNIIHMCGKGNIDDEMTKIKGYVQYEFVDDELKDLYAMADLIISRAGANTLFEILAARKPNILIPLSKAASRGEQVLNAEGFEEEGYSRMLLEEHANKFTLVNDIEDVLSKKDSFVKNMEESKVRNAEKLIIEIIEDFA